MPRTLPIAGRNGRVHVSVVSHFVCELPDHLDPYSFADDLAEEIDAEQDSNEDRSTEEVLLTALASTTDEKLTGFAIRLALTGHVGIPREDEPDSLAEATMTFVLTQELQKGGKPKLVPTPAKKKNAAKKAAKRKAA